MESRQKSKTSRDLEESHTDKEIASAHFPKSSFEHTRTIKPQELSLSRMPHRDSLSREFLPYDFSSSSVEPSESLAYRYNNSDYEKLKREHSRLRDEHAYLQGRMCEVYRELKEIKSELNELRQDYIKLHSHNKYINHENEVLRAEINNLKSQISSQDDADVKSSESESNDNDNRPGKKRKSRDVKLINQTTILKLTKKMLEKNRVESRVLFPFLNVMMIDWRSDETAQLTRGRNYDDESYCITSRHPKNAPEWAYKTQNTPIDTDFSVPDTPAENRESQSQTDDNTQTEHND
ncbi:hypothetical protein GLOIN_2v1823870 [Rhizophagus irregularis DAOM 181602=DAOM 197198]|nr:hypothetical protein GLOIN_2v1823870 [Rhizophagus irregularis DAOM 181602=DAOM 197198]